MLILTKLYFMNKRQVKTFPEREKKKKKKLRGFITIRLALWASQVVQW